MISPAELWFFSFRATDIRHAYFGDQCHQSQNAPRLLFPNSAIGALCCRRCTPRTVMHLIRKLVAKCNIKQSATEFIHKLFPWPLKLFVEATLSRCKAVFTQLCEITSSIITWVQRLAITAIAFSGNVRRLSAWNIPSRAGEKCIAREAIMRLKRSAIINSISVESKNTAAARSCGNYRG